MIITEEEIQGFEDFFKSVKLPDTPFKMSLHETIVDFDKFINGHISVLKSHKDKSWIMPYIDRLEQLKISITKFNISKNT